jgi:D-alanine-D-alanine ligase
MKTIGLFCGGFSSEYDISMKSAQTIYDSFPDEYTLHKIQVTKDEWFCQSEASGKKEKFNKNDACLYFEDKKISIELAIVCIHGDPGENGKIQAYLDLMGIPYLNSSAEASSISFDKYLCNQFLSALGFKTAKSALITKNGGYDAAELVDQLELPLFIKPTDSGSSYGISKVYKEEAIGKAISAAFEEGETVIAESFLDGIELTCAVFRSKKGLIALPITQISTENDFFDYDAKYNGKSSEETPAKVSAALTLEIQETSKEIYDALQLGSVARIDYIVMDGKPFVIEVNTIPGFSKASIVPQMLKCAGIALDEFWKMIIDAELNK